MKYVLKVLRRDENEAKSDAKRFMFVFSSREQNSRVAARAELDVAHSFQVGIVGRGHFSPLRGTQNDVRRLWQRERVPIRRSQAGSFQPA